MKLDEMRGSEKEFLTPEDVAEVIGCKAHAINLQARSDPSALGFPVCMMGTRVRIPRQGFLHWMSFGNAPVCERRSG